MHDEKTVGRREEADSGEESEEDEEAAEGLASLTLAGTLEDGGEAGLAVTTLVSATAVDADAELDG